jgi:hypothetical protein
MMDLFIRMKQVAYKLKHDLGCFAASGCGCWSLHWMRGYKVVPSCSKLFQASGCYRDV